jgi:PPP family 3-phenylpropionic acid transporter
MAYAAPLLARTPPARLLAFAYLGGALRWLCLALLPRAALGFLFQPLHAVSFGLVWLASLELVRRSSEPAALGSGQGLFMAANATGSVFGMLVWGPLYAAQGGRVIYAAATGLALGAAALCYALLCRSREPAVAL